MGIHVNGMAETDGGTHALRYSSHQPRTGLVEDPAQEATMPIAIVGMSCRFPGDATSPEKLWQMCAEGRSAWSKIPADRFNSEAFYHPQAEHMGTSNVLGAHFLTEDVSLFDASFFNFSAEVASSMDPQYRLQLESTFEALESAGIPLSAIAGTRASVFAGAFFRDYHDLLMRDPETLPRYFMTGNGTAMISNRISHFFDLRGASITVDTGCSTGLTALHLACQSIRTGESRTSIVGGANVMINPDMFISMSSLGLLGPDGKSYSFDSRASGYGRGEGVATLVLKSLQDAINDGDPIRAVIRETLLNQDGKTPTLTSPSQEAQEELIRRCYQNAGLDPMNTTYVEAHGTGTRMGDPIEASAIGSVLGKARPSGKLLYLASVKSNIGHLEAASGLASVVKAALALEKGQIPPSINFETPNPAIHLDEWRLKIPRKLEPWPTEQLRRASLSNFGYGGTNAHVIMDASLYHHSPTILNRPRSTQNGVNDKWLLYKLSAKDESAAKSMIVELCAYLKSAQEHDNQVTAQDLAYTLGQRRSNFPWVEATPARSLIELIEALDNTQLKPSHTSGIPRLGFVFNGQGAQWFAMGRELIGAYPVFERSLYEATSYLKELGATWSLIEELMRDSMTSRVNEPIMSLSLSCAIQLSLVRLLRSWNINPCAVTGHSSGEASAAFAAGAITFEEALAIVYVRGALTTSFLPKSKHRGAMLAVGLGQDAAAPYLSSVSSGKAVVACVNSPLSVTLAGDIQAIEEIEETIAAEGIFARRVKVEVAYHSHHMTPISADYRNFLKRTLKPEGDFGHVIYSSPVTGERIASAHELGPEHWVCNMVQPVLFAQSFRNMCIERTSLDSEDLKQSIDMIVEIGPHGALAGPIRQTLSLPELKDFGISCISCLNRGQDAVQTMQNLACSLLTKGYPVDLEAVNFPQGAEDLRVIPSLPSYPWNHTIQHWMEPRINRNYRRRKFAHHDLIGTLLPGANPIAPIWRHVIRQSEIPWVTDHMVQSDVVYPGAGCICMALEAIRQVSETPERSIIEYNLRDIEIMKALLVPDSADGVEVQLSLSNCSDKSLHQDWKEFNVYSAGNDDRWNEHCKGLISVKYGPSFKGLTSHEADLDSRFAGYPRSIHPDDFFKSLQALGIKHGASFRNIESIDLCQDQSITTFSIADTVSMMPFRHQHDHILHPITLDAIFQAAYTVMSTSETKAMGAAIPTSIKTMAVRTDLSHQVGHQLQASTTLHKRSPQGFEVSVSAVNKGETHSCAPLKVGGIHYQSLGAAPVHEQIPNDSKLCMTFKWGRDLSTIDSKSMRESLVVRPSPTETAIIEDLKRATFHFVHDALAALTDADIDNLKGHHKKLFDWIKFQERRASLNQISPKSSRWNRASTGIKQRLYDSVAAASVNGKMLVRIGKNLVSILRKEVAPLELMLENKLLYTYYEQMLRIDRSLIQVEQLVKLFAHKNPRATILEIGGGTGACTGPVLRALGGGDSGFSPQFSHYDFTDISSGFFETAREKFAAWGDLISYRKFDIENGAEEQTFTPGSYDLIIACQVLHATKEMDHTMKNVRRLLNPGGKLIMVETTQDCLDVQLVFGTLPGWWLSAEEERKHSPNMPTQSWERILSRTGFSGLEVELPDSTNIDTYTMSVIMTTAIKDVPQDFSLGVSIVFAESQPPQSYVNTLKTSIASVTSTKITTAKLSDLHVVGQVCIFLDTDKAILDQIDGSNFTAVKKLLNDAKGVLWISRGGTMDCNRPTNALHTGLLRTLRLENSSKRFISLDLDPKKDPWAVASISCIVDVFRSTFDYAQDMHLLDNEYSERELSIYVPRLHDSTSENNSVAESNTGNPPEMQPFHQLSRELRMVVDTPGSLDSLVFNDDSSARETIPDDFVEIAPKAFGLNFRDIMVAMGQLQETVMGFECSGIVTRLGPNATHEFKVGDRVCALTTRGHWASCIRTHWTGIGKIPDHMTFETAATVPMVFITSYFALHDIGRLRKDETVLIHAATGGVGQAAIILAKNIGAEIYVTVGSQEKRDFVKKMYDIEENHILSSRDPSFGPRIMDLTNGKGVDVVLNSLSGQLLQESWNCVARFGRFVEIGKRDIQLNKNLEMENFGRAISFSAIDLIHLGNHKGKVVSSILKKIIRMLDDEVIRPVQPITVYPIAELRKAFRVMQVGKHIGKIVVRPNEGDLVKVLREKRPVSLSPTSSYLVVGGLGGIGRSIVQWLIQHGAKHLILLSRSSASGKEPEAFLSELRASGCIIVIKSCDVAQRPALAEAIKECAQHMPPIRGVIQAAMVLQDSVFEYMPIQSWEAAIRPKVQGTLNLDSVLSKTELDFFIMLSSATGILGNPSQANYAAGGTFQDAFARYRASQNLPGVSIDLGIVKSVGYVAETKGVAERLGQVGWRPLEEDEVMRIIEAAISRPVRTQQLSQIVTGLAPFKTSGAIYWRQEQRFSALKQIHTSSPIQSDKAGGKKGTRSLQDSLGKATNWTDAENTVVGAIIKKMSEMFMVPEGEIDASMPMSNYGVDSLVAVELRNWLVARAQADLSIFDVLQSSSLRALAKRVAAKSRLIVEAGIVPMV